MDECVPLRGVVEYVSSSSGEMHTTDSTSIMANRIGVDCKNGEPIILVEYAVHGADVMCRHEIKIPKESLQQ